MKKVKKTENVEAKEVKVEEKTVETKKCNPIFKNTIVLAVVVAIASSLITILILKLFVYKTNNVTGSWYNTYADQTFVLTLKGDKTFEYGYEGSDQVTGKYTNSNDVIVLTSDSGDTKLVYEKGNNYIEIDSTKYYSSKKEAEKNDSFYYIPKDYDTSMFTAITPSEFVEKFKAGDTAFVMFARGSCGYCQQFRPVAAESVEKYNYKLYYLNTTQLKSEDINTISALDSKLNAITSTPSVYYIKGKKVVDVQEGYTDIETYGAFLTKNGVKKK